MILLPFIVIKTNVNRDEQVSISNFSLSLLLRRDPACYSNVSLKPNQYQINLQGSLTTASVRNSVLDFI